MPFLFLTVAGATLVAVPAGAQSTWRPDRNVELVVGSTPGSGQDKTARVIQRIWKDAKLVEVTSSVVNKPGGGGAIADAYVSQHVGDAHTLMTASPTLLTSHITGRSKLNYTDSHAERAAVRREHTRSWCAPSPRSRTAAISSPLLREIPRR